MTLFDVVEVMDSHSNPSSVMDMAILEGLDEWNKENSEASNFFLPEFGGDIASKKMTLSVIMKSLRLYVEEVNSRGDSAIIDEEEQDRIIRIIRVLLISLRILSREKDGIEAIKGKEDLDFFFNLSGLGDLELNKTSEYVISMESLKIINNIMAHFSISRGVHDYAIERRVHVAIFDKIKELSVSKVNEDDDINTIRMLAMLARVNFTIICGNEDGQRELMEAGILELVINTISNHVGYDEALDLRFLDTDLQPKVDFLSHLFKLSFLFTIKYGPLANNDVEVGVPSEMYPTFDKLLKAMRKVFAYEPIQPPLFEQMFSLIINLPPEFIAPFLHEEHIEKIVAFLKSRISTPGIKPHEVLPPLFMALTRVSQFDQAVSVMLGKHFLPRPSLDEQNLSGSNEKAPLIDILAGDGEEFFLKKKMVEYLRSGNISLKHTVGDFLMALCGENGSIFVEHFGFGNVAGYIAEKGLYASFSGGKKSVPQNVPSDGGGGVEEKAAKPSKEEAEDSEGDEVMERMEPEMTARNMQNFINDLENVRQSRTQSNQQGQRLEQMTEEELEDSAMELGRKIERLNELGIIRMAVPSEISAASSDTNASHDADGEKDLDE